MGASSLGVWKRTACAAGVVLALTACNKNEPIEQKPDPAPPKIVLEADDTGIYRLKVGASITLSPTVENAENAGYTWLQDGRTVASGEKSYTFSEVVSGQYFVTFRVSTPYGEDEVDFRMDVSEFAPPVISFGLPDGTMNALAGNDYNIHPSVLNAEDAVFEWNLNGAVVGSETQYTFNQTEQKTHSLTLAVTNGDGRDEKTLRITVLGELPLHVRFDKPLFTSQSTDIHLFAGQPAHLWPLVEGGSELAFQWSVNGSELDETGESLVFTPVQAGKTTVSVVVTSGSSGRAESIARSITRSGFTRATASVNVFCHGTEPDSGRPVSPGSSEAASRVFEYLPGPGQFINEPLSGFAGEHTFEAAAAYAEKRLASGNYISLGAFGGYVTVGFDHSIPNKGGHSGYDFAIDGNPFNGGSEPGIVWVMQDANGNGLPDDVWYELKGSETGKTGTLQRYAVTYARPAADRAPVRWQDNRGGQGEIDWLPFHAQPSYYPAWIAADTYTLRGTRLENNAYRSTYEWILPGYEWGYADNDGTDRLNNNGNSSAEAVGVRFKLSNAILPDGRPANLRYIDFVKVQTGVHAQCGELGETSTEVFSIRDLNMP